MRKARLLEGFNFIMTALVALPAAVLLQELFLPGLAPWRAVILLLPSFLAYFAGRALHGRPSRVAAPAGALLALALTAPAFVAVGFRGVYPIVFNLFAAGLTFVLFSVPYRTGAQIAGGRRFFAGVALYLMALLSAGEHREAYTAALSVCLFVFFVAGVIAFNAESLKAAARNRDGKLFFPPGMRRSNVLLTALLILAALFIANIGLVQRALAAAVRFITELFYAFLAFLDNFRPDEQVAGNGNSTHFFAGGGENAPNRLWDMIMRALLILVGILMAAAVLFVLFRFFRWLYRRLRTFIAWLRRVLRSQESTGYVDESESSLEKGEWRLRLRKRLGDFGALGRRPLRFDRLSPAQKVRVLYRLLLRRIRPDRRGRTPNEQRAGFCDAARGAEPAEIERFVALYNAVRYAESGADEEAGTFCDALRKRL